MGDALISRSPKDSNINIVQESGASTTNVMSQKACTDSFALKSHNHTVSDLTSGTLSVSRDGTGASSLARARTNLDVYSKSEVDSKASVLSEDMSVYISPSGSDSTGTGSSSNPYATFNKVLSLIESKKIDAQISVYVKSGTYNEELKLLYLSGAGRIRILGDSSSSVSFSSCRIGGNTLKDIEIHKIKISKESGTCGRLYGSLLSISFLLYTPKLLLASMALDAPVPPLIISKDLTSVLFILCQERQVPKFLE